MDIRTQDRGPGADNDLAASLGQVLRNGPPVPIGVSNTGNKGSLAAEVDVEPVDGHGQGGRGAVGGRGRGGMSREKLKITRRWRNVKRDGGAWEPEKGSIATSLHSKAE